MLVSLLIKLRVSENIEEIKFPSKYFQGMFLEVGETDYIVSKVLGKSLFKISLEKNEEFSIRMTIYTKKSFEKISMYLFQKKLLNQSINYEGHNFDIKGVYSGGDKRVWGNNFENISLHDISRIQFYTPLILIHGEKYLEEFDLFIFFKSIEKRLLDRNILENKIFTNSKLLKVIKKINVKEDLKLKQIKLKKLYMNGILGQLIFDLSELEENEKNDIKKLLKIGYFINSGYNTEYGFGMYRFIDLE